MSDSMHQHLSLSFTQAVKQFMQIGDQTTDAFNPRQACLYTGLQLEELGEKIKAIADGAVSITGTARLMKLAAILKDAAKEFKAGMHEGDILRAYATHGKDFIDGDFDLAWVSIGALFSECIDTHGAISHGAWTNHDKFVFNDRRERVALKDENGKIQKRPGWVAPDFERFVDRTPRD